MILKTWDDRKRFLTKFQYALIDKFGGNITMYLYLEVYYEMIISQVLVI